jgi:hypothetical protein
MTPAVMQFNFSLMVRKGQWSLMIGSLTVSRRIIGLLEDLRKLMKSGYSSWKRHGPKSTGLTKELKPELLVKRYTLLPDPLVRLNFIRRLLQKIFGI